MLYEKTNYLNKDINFLANTKIIEYDMHDAGFSLIKEHKLLSNGEIGYITNLSKKDKNIYIGKLMRTKKDLSINLMNAFKEKRKEFIISNNIDDDEILSIKKDAIFLINRMCKYTHFNKVDFNMKNRYTSYYYINNIEFYFNGNTKNLDIKGISNEKKSLHLNFFLNDLKYFFKINEINIRRSLDKLYDYRKDYLNKKLSIGTYRELNEESKFKILDNILMNNFYSEYELSLDYIDISYNYINYIIPLISYII